MNGKKGESKHYISGLPPTYFEFIRKRLKRKSYRCIEQINQLFIRAFSMCTFGLILIGFLLTSCTVEESPIVFGKDACHDCMMNIVDKQYAAEIVTQKGKPFKYDAIECMMRDIVKKEENSIALFLITDYFTPGKFVDATKATYLISENLPSPMGANLTGFSSKAKAEKVQKEKNGTLYSWNELKIFFEK